MKTHAQPRWRRNQMEAALWRYSVTHRNWGGDWDQLASDIPTVFRSRVKKLLNMDRIPDLTPWERSDEHTWAFYDAPGEGVGSEDRFSTQHAFLMGIGLDLVNEGLKQSEVVFFLRERKATLTAAFNQIHERPGAIAPVSASNRQHQRFDEDGSAEPIWLDPMHPPLADWTAWMVVRRHETKEAYPGFEKRSKGRNIPFFMEPEFYFGLEEVKKQLFTHLSSFRHLILIEIADLALTLPHYLAEIPAIGRGRPPASAVRAQTVVRAPGRRKKGAG
jgi:hypothetical protein